MQDFLNARHEEFALEDDFFWQFAVEFDEEFVLEEQFAVPLCGVDFLSFGKNLRGHGVFEAVHVDVGVVGKPADRGFERVGTEAAAFDHPTQDARVFAESGP